MLEQLLKSGWFIDNEYLKQYFDLMNSHDCTNVIYTERHHIIQRKYFELCNLPIDNSKTNLVQLSFADHVKAHWLLYNCTTGKLKSANRNAFISMVTFNTDSLLKRGLTESEYMSLQQYHDKCISEQDNEYWSQEEDDYLAKHYLEPVATISVNLGRTKLAVAARLSRLGLVNVKRSKFTEAELKFIKANYAEKGRFWVAEQLGRTPGAIQSKANELGLHQNRTLIYCPELNRYWRSISSVAKELGIAINLIVRVLNGIQKQTHGYTFKKI